MRGLIGAIRRLVGLVLDPEGHELSLEVRAGYARARCSCGWVGLPHYSTKSARREAGDHREAWRS